MYVIQKSKTIKDTIMLEDGEKKLQIDFEMDPSFAAKQYWKYAGELYKRKTLERKDPSPENIQALGDAFMALMKIIFGEKNAEKILEFYDGNFVLFMQDIYPYLVNEIFPKLRKESQKKAKEMRKIR